MLANLEANPFKKANILSYVSQLHHDMVDFWFLGYFWGKWRRSRGP